jgi:hypothetical protein
LARMIQAVATLAEARACSLSKGSVPGFRYAATDDKFKRATSGAGVKLSYVGAAALDYGDKSCIAP